MSESEDKFHNLDFLLREIQNCKICIDTIPQIRPVLRASIHSKILVAGQAPGRFVHETGIPWNDASGRLLRQWMGVTDEEFYNTDFFAIIPSAFCYPGKGKSGDNPPPPICAKTWQARLLSNLPRIELIIATGSYAIKNHIGISASSNLTTTVRNYKDYLPLIIPLVHPSPRNKLWLINNPWFETEVVPELRKRVRRIMNKIHYSARNM